MSAGDAPDSRWTVRGPADDPAALLRRAAEFLESLGGPTALRALSWDRGGDDGVLTVVFDHWLLPADLDYLDPRIAGDPGHGMGPRDDHGFMIALADRLDAGAGARTVVDFGCGWGELAVALARRGHRVIGVDPAKAMLDLARAGEGADLVEWVWGDAHSLDGLRDVAVVDLVVMTGNIPSIYVTDDGWATVLAAVHGVLRPGGRLAFGSWNPGARPWESWGWNSAVVHDGAGARVRTLPGTGGMELAGGSETLYAGSEWRYRTADELTQSLAGAGFVVEEAYGDWDRSPLTPTSPEIVLVARRS